MKPRSSFTPAFSSPMFSVLGTMPMATIDVAELGLLDLAVLVLDRGGDAIGADLEVARRRRRS